MVIPHLTNALNAIVNVLPVVVPETLNVPHVWEERNSYGGLLDLQDSLTLEDVYYLVQLENGKMKRT